MNNFSRLIVAVGVAALSSVAIGAETSATRPNIIFIMSDDHAAHAISAYGSKINKTPHIDAIAREGMLLKNCFATNALCAPSRATILTSKYSHLNGTTTHRSEPFDGSQVTYPKLLQKAGYQTAIVGKWHLKSDPTGFDYWNILPGQGAYFDPPMIENGVRQKHKGYATDIITDLSIKFLENRDKNRPFLLVTHHKAPHRWWEPDQKHAKMYEGEEIPQPETFDDDYTSRAVGAKRAKIRILGDLNERDVKAKAPTDMSDDELKNWYYQRFIKDYLRCVASVDDNVGRLLKYAKDKGLLENTIVIYTSDQGAFLGDHGWYDKRFMYEHSIRMPFVVRYPKEIKAGTRTDAMVTNVDFAPTLLDYAGVAPAEGMQGKSFRQALKGETPADWQVAMYYHYYEYPAVQRYAPRHYGIRDSRYKLIRYYMPEDAWEFFDLEKDPNEMQNRIDDPEYADEIAKMKTELVKMRKKYQDNTGPDVDEAPPGKNNPDLAMERRRGGGRRGQADGEE